MDREEVVARMRIRNQLCAVVRGKLLNEAAVLDVVLSDALARFFCPYEDRRKILFAEVMSAEGLTLYAKTKVLLKILKIDFAQIEKQYPKLRARIDEVREFRNMLAHAHPDTSEVHLAAAEPKAAAFVSINAERYETVEIDEDALVEWGDKIIKLRNDILEISSKIAAPDVSNGTGTSSR